MKNERMMEMMVYLLWLVYPLLLIPRRCVMMVLPPQLLRHIKDKWKLLLGVVSKREAPQ
jgi:hypothetical protein